MAADDPNILIMAEDADTDGVPRNSRISTRIVNSVVTQLDQRRYRVYDETAVTINTHRQVRTRRTDAELIDIAKSIRKPPIDVVVFFTVYANVDRRKHSNDLHLRIVGRLLSVHDGRRLGNWEEELPDRWSLPNRCFQGNKGVSRDCLLEVVGRDARRIATGMISVLAERLGDRFNSSSRRRKHRDRDNRSHIVDYSLELDDFSNRQIQDIEDYLIIFRGYNSHQANTSYSGNVEIIYRSTIKRNRLTRNLKRMLDELNIRAQVDYDGNNFTLRQTLANNRRDGYRHVRGYFR